MKKETMSKEVRPLRATTMTLGELQLQTLDLMRRVRFQLQHAPHEDGMNDVEFMEKVLSPFEFKIYADREILKMKRKSNSKRKDQ